MTPADRPVADREPLSAEDAKNLREVVESQARLGHPMTIVPNDVLLRLLATLDAARAHPDEAGLREALEGLSVVNIQGVEMVTRSSVIAVAAGHAAQPAVPVAGAEDWYDRDAKAFARAHAQTGALRAAQPEDDVLDVERLARATARVVGSEAMGWHREWAAKVAAEYARLSESSEGVERRDGA